jgi:hypothetical protein
MRGWRWRRRFGESWGLVKRRYATFWGVRKADLVIGRRFASLPRIAARCKGELALLGAL